MIVYIMAASVQHTHSLVCERLLPNTGSSGWCSVMTWRGRIGEVWAQEERGVCIIVANSPCCVMAANTTL